MGPTKTPSPTSNPPGLRRSASVFRWSISKTPVMVAAAPVVNDFHHSEDSFVGGAELEDREAVPGYVMTILDEITHGFSDCDLSRSRELSQRPDDCPDPEGDFVTLFQQDVRRHSCHHVDRVESTRFFFFFLFLKVTYSGSNCTLSSASRAGRS